MRSAVDMSVERSSGSTQPSQPSLAQRREHTTATAPVAALHIHRATKNKAIVRVVRTPASSLSEHSGGSVF